MYAVWNTIAKYADDYMEETVRLKYWVDWADSTDPVIRVHNPDDTSSDPVTFTEAKREIIEHFQYLKEYALYKLDATRSLRASDIAEGDQ